MLRSLWLLAAWSALGAACPKQKPPEPTTPAAMRRDLDSDDPADPNGACPPGSARGDDGCPGVDAGSPLPGSLDGSRPR